MTLLKTGILITKRGFLISALVFVLFHTLHLIFSAIISRHLVLSPDNRLLAHASFNFMVAITLIPSSFIVDRINKVRSIYLSSLAILFLTIILFIVPNDYLRIAVLLVIGTFFSLGLLALLSYFWTLTSSEERGRIAGFIGFVALPINFIAAYIIAPNIDFISTLTISIVASLGIAVIGLLMPKKSVLTRKIKSEEIYFEKRTAVLYSIPWIIFSLVNVTLAKNTSLIISQQVSASSYLSLLELQLIGVTFGSIIGGIIADFFGRRLSLAFSLTSYGTSAALIGIFTNNEVLSLAYFTNGLSWGILFILYIFVIFGDLANKANSAKMYSFGLAIYYLTLGIGIVEQINIPLTVSSLATCLLIFLLNIPVLLSPELLSSSFRERIGRKRYLNTVKKIDKKSNQEE